jgi:hypothetical protein
LPEGSFRREFQAATCAEAVATVAVIAAMVLDAAPAARREMTELPAFDAPAPAPPVTEPEPPPEQPPVEAAVPPPQKTPSKPLEKRAPVPPLHAPAKPLHWSIAMGGAFETAVAPTPPVAAVASVEAFVNGSGWWAPGLRASVLATATATEHVATGDGKFRLLAGHLGTCPLRIPLGALVRLLPCAAFEAGSLRAEGGGAATNTRTATMPWLAAAVAVRSQLRLSGAVAVEAGVEAKLLARHDTFVFRPTSLVYEVPLWSLGLGLGVLVNL